MTSACNVAARGAFLYRAENYGDRLQPRRCPSRPRGGVVTQRSAKPCTPVQFRAWPPTFARAASEGCPPKLQAKAGQRAAASYGPAIQPGQNQGERTGIPAAL